MMTTEVVETMEAVGSRWYSVVAENDEGAIPRKQRLVRGFTTGEFARRS